MASARAIAGSERRARQALVDVTTALAPGAADACLAEQQIGDHADHRHDQDDNYPGQARGRFAVGPEDGAQQDRQFGEDEQPRQDQVEEGQAFAIPVKRSDRPPNSPPPSHL